MKIKKRRVYKGKVICVDILEEKRGKFLKEIVIYPKSVAILPIFKGKIILISQYRLPAKKYLWEIPAGKLNKGEKPLEGGKRELKEETGFLVKKLEKLGEFYLTPGYSTEYMYLFKGEVSKKGRAQREKGEIIKKVKAFSLEELFEMIKKKEIVDIKTILSIYLLKERWKILS